MDKWCLNGAEMVLEKGLDTVVGKSILCTERELNIQEYRILK